MNNSMHRAKLISRIVKNSPKFGKALVSRENSKHVKTGETVEPQSLNKNDSDSRFDATKSVVRIYRNDTPGQKLKSNK